MIFEDEYEYDDEDDILFSAFYSSSSSYSGDFQYYTRHLTPEAGHLFEATS